MTPREQVALEDGLFLALRQCATHSAGPLRAVADLYGKFNGSDLLVIFQRLNARLDAMQMPDDRRDVLDRFLTVVETGLLGGPYVDA